MLEAIAQHQQLAAESSSEAPFGRDQGSGRLVDKETTCLQENRVYRLEVQDGAPSGHNLVESSKCRVGRISEAVHPRAEMVGPSVGAGDHVESVPLHVAVHFVAEP